MVRRLRAPGLRLSRVEPCPGCRCLVVSGDHRRPNGRPITQAGSQGCGRLTLTDGELAPERIAASSSAWGRS